MNLKKTYLPEPEPEKKELILLGTNITFIKHGFCFTTRAEIIKNGETVYLLTREEETRKEFFFGNKTPARTYEGAQFCFLEYCALADNIKLIPDHDAEIPDLCSLTNILNHSYINIYKGALEKIVRN